MQNPRTKLAMFLILFTAGIVINLIDIEWLAYLGIALILISGEFSSSRNKVSVSVLILLLAMCAFASWDGWNVSNNVRTPCSLSHWIFLIVIWLLGLSWEYWSWRKNNWCSSHDKPPPSTLP